MISLSPNASIYLIGSHVDLRNGFDGLNFIASTTFKFNLPEDSYIVFFNERRTRIKILCNNDKQSAIWYVRSQKGPFFPPRKMINGLISASDLFFILNNKLPTHIISP